MDNLTHTLIGAVVAETAVRCMPVFKTALPEKRRRQLCFPLLVVGSNFPDLDLLYSGATDLGQQLGYLLHHRGHTHTLVAALVIALLLYGCAHAWLRRQQLVATATDRCCLAFLALLAPLLHIGMDATNSYGVHPFWPFDNRWYYGDAVFIIEPLFWVAAAPLLLLLQSRPARAVMALILVIAVALTFGSGLVPRPLGFALVLLLAALLLVAWRCNGRTAALCSLTTSAGIVLMFLFASHRASVQLRTQFSAQFPTATLLDSVQTPAPVNPFCWDVIAVALDGDNYSLRHGAVALTPQWLPAAECANPNSNARTTATFTPVPVTNSAGLHWYGERVMSRAKLRAEVTGNCEAMAFAGFGRALWLVQAEQRWWLGDFRFDREPGAGFAEIEITRAPANCPTHVPPWLPPRTDVLFD